MIYDDEEWRDEAKCLTVDPAIFFPLADWQTTKAREVCSGCPVAKQCLDLAITNDERFGIWAGLDRTERNAERRKRERKARA